VPAFAVLIGFVWLGEVPLVGELLGGVVVIAGVVLVSLGDRILARGNGWIRPVRARTAERARRLRVPAAS
jgi:drug/metabolite transporter (DMT)-like permease